MGQVLGGVAVEQNEYLHLALCGAKECRRHYAAGFIPVKYIGL